MKCTYQKLIPGVRQITDKQSKFASIQSHLPSSITNNQRMKWIGLCFIEKTNREKTLHFLVKYYARKYHTLKISFAAYMRESIRLYLHMIF